MFDFINSVFQTSRTTDLFIVEITPSTILGSLYSFYTTRSGEANLRYSSSELAFVRNPLYLSAFLSLFAWGDISLRFFSDLGKVGTFKVFFIILSISTLH